MMEGRTSGSPLFVMMKHEVVQQLLVLNQQFYEQFARPFSQSRLQPQPGFERVVAFLPQPCVRLLDVGCGDGRFGRFLQTHQVINLYTGVDFSSNLLTIAQEQTTGNFHQRDIAQAGCLAGLGQFEAIVCLAALHHLPGRNNRVRLLAEMREHLAENGRIVLSTWQFATSHRQQRKLVAWSQIGLSSDDVEPHDFLLTWERGGSGLRYACQIDEAETAELARLAGLQVYQHFLSDGKEGNLSLYTILGK